MDSSQPQEVSWYGWNGLRIIRHIKCVCSECGSCRNNSNLYIASAYEFLGVRRANISSMLVRQNKITKNTNTYRCSICIAACLWALGYTTVQGLEYQLNAMPIQLTNLEAFLDHNIFSATLVPNNTYTIGSQYNSKQCIQVLTTGTLSTVSCSIPPYCGIHSYTKISSTWYGTEIGVCVGAGIFPEFFSSQELGVKIAKNLYRVYHVQLTTLKKLSVASKLVKTTFATKMNIDEINMDVLVHPITGEFYVRSSAIRSSFPQFDVNGNLLPPNYIDSENGLKCIPRVNSIKIPIMLGPFNQQGAINNSKFFHCRPSIDPSCYQGSLVLDYAAILEHGAVKLQTQSVDIRCDPGYATLSVLPGGVFSATLHVMGQAVAIICQTLLDILWYPITFLYDQTVHFINLPTLILISLYSVYKYNLRLLDSAIIGLVGAVVVELLATRQL